MSGSEEYQLYPTHAAGHQRDRRARRRGRAGSWRARLRPNHPRWLPPVVRDQNFLGGYARGQKIFAANPAAGSRHSRGCAVDLSLYDLETGIEVRMPSGYGEMSDHAYADYAGGSADERARRALLRHAMERQGFNVNPAE